MWMFWTLLAIPVGLLAWGTYNQLAEDKRNALRCPTCKMPWDGIITEHHPVYGNMFAMYRVCPNFHKMPVGSSGSQTQSAYLGGWAP